MFVSSYYDRLTTKDGLLQFRENCPVGVNKRDRNRGGKQLQNIQLITISHLELCI